MADENVGFHEFKRWVVEHEYQDALPILATSIPNLNHRVGLLQKDLETARGLLQSVEEEQGEAINDPERSQRIGQDPKLHRLAIELYYAILDSIARLHGLVEILIVYYGTLRMGVGNLPKMLTDRRPVEYNVETKRIRRLRLTDLKRDFKFPNISDYQCTSDDRAFLREILSRTAKSLRQQLRDLASFRERFLAIHNKYKHSLVEDTSRFLVVRANGEINCIPQFYVRSKEQSPRSQQNRVYTYVVRVDEDFIDYLDSLIDKFATVIVSLVDTYIQWLANKGKPAFPRHVDLAQGDEGRLQSILEAESSFIHVKDLLPEFRVTWGLRAIQRVERGVERHHIARLSLDMLDPKKLKRFNIERVDG